MLKSSVTTCSRVYVATGFTDIRCGVKSLAAKIEYAFGQRPYEKDVLYLFCGKRNDRIKGLIWEGDGWLLLYKRLEKGSRFSWPRAGSEAVSISEQQFDWLMHGFSIYARVNEVTEPPAHVM